MGLWRNVVANISGIIAILIIIGGYHYITLVTLGGVPSLELDPFGSQTKLDPKPEPPKSEYKGPINITPNDFLLVNTKKCRGVRHKKANKVGTNWESQHYYYSSFKTNNKPRTAKVGAISKAQNCERGDPLGFFHIHCVAKYRKK